MMISHQTDHWCQADLHIQCMSTAPTLLNDLEGYSWKWKRKTHTVHEYSHIFV